MRTMPSENISTISLPGICAIGLSFVDHSTMRPCLLCLEEFLGLTSARIKTRFSPIKQGTLVPPTPGPDAPDSAPFYFKVSPLCASCSPERLQGPDSRSSSRYRIRDRRGNRERQKILI